MDATASGARRVRRAASHRERTTARKMNDTRCVRQNRVVSTPVAGAKLSVANSVQPDRSAIKPAVTEARRIRLRRERGISRKAIAQGMPECSDCTCMLVCVFLRTYSTRDRGCSVHPAFPAPSSRGTRFWQASGATRRENAGLCLFRMTNRRLTREPPAIRKSQQNEWQERWSEWQDSNLRPLRPERSALPG